MGEHQQMAKSSYCVTSHLDQFGQNVWKSTAEGLFPKLH